VCGRDAARGAGTSEAHHGGAPRRGSRRAGSGAGCALEPNIAPWSCMQMCVAHGQKETNGSNCSAERRVIVTRDLRNWKTTRKSKRATSEQA
jgi:hypothetical protein